MNEKNFGPLFSKKSKEIVSIANLHKWLSIMHHTSIYFAQHEQGGGLEVPNLKVKKLKVFVTLTPNLIPKSLETHRFLNKTLQFAFLGLENTIFSKFRPRGARDFAFSPSIKKFLDAPMGTKMVFV